MFINNLPDYYTEYAYIVFRVWDGECWFWGCWNDRQQAHEAAVEIGGAVCPTECL